MKTSTTKLIAILATTAGLLTSSVTLAKGPGKSGSGGSGGSNHSNNSNRVSSNSNSSLKTFKLSNNSNSSNHSNSMSGISKKDLNFKKQDHNNGISGISLNKKVDKKFDKKFDMNSKDFCKKDFCKKDFCWWDSCYSKNSCYPYYFGCYYPTYSCYSPSYCYTPSFSCYDYCTPTYTTCNYNTSSITVLQNVAPSRTIVPVGSTLMVNGQAFGDKAGGARLRVSGMALPIEVIEWTPGGVKVRLPQVEITGNTPAEIEVVRGDGSLASKMPVELTASPEQLALGR